MPMHKSNVQFKKGIRGPGFANAEYYNAIAYTTGGVSFDCAAEINDGMQDLETLGGKMFFGPGSYTFNESLIMRPGVSLYGIPDATKFYINHATQPLMRMTTNNNRKQFTEVCGIAFCGGMPTTGVAISGEAADQKWLFRNCSWNSPNMSTPNLNGAIFADQGPGNTDCTYQFEDCYANSKFDGAAFSMSTAGSQMNFSGGKYVWPTTLTGSGFITYTNGRGSLGGGMEFDATPHTTGSDSSCLSVLGGSANVVLVDNVYAIGSGGPPKFFMSSPGGSLVKVSNLYNTVITRYNTAALLADGSKLEMLPSSLYTGGAITVTIPDNVASATVEFTGASLAITFPTKFFRGQELDLILCNSSAGPRSPTIAGSVLYANPPSMESLQIMSAKFRVSDPFVNNSWQWTQVGGWALTIL